MTVCAEVPIESAIDDSRLIASLAQRSRERQKTQWRSEHGAGVGGQKQHYFAGLASA